MYEDSSQLSDKTSKVVRVNEVVHSAAREPIRLMTDNCSAGVGGVANAAIL